MCGRTALVVALCLCACTEAPRSLGSDYKSRSQTSNPTPTFEPPPNQRVNTPPDAPPPETQAQPPVPVVTLPEDPDEEEIGGGSEAPPPIPGRPYGGGIGSNCDAANACSRDATVCLSTGYSGGHCSKPCSRGCPDDGDFKTFCIADQSASGGICVSQCTQTSDCRSGYKCVTRARHVQPDKTAKVCVPETEQERTCFQTLKDILPHATGWVQPTDTWFACGGAETLCDVRDPVSVPYIMNSVAFEHTSEPSTYVDMSCRMAHQLFRLGYIAKQYGVTKVKYSKLYACETPDEGDVTDEHGEGEALDLKSITIGSTEHAAGSAKMNEFLRSASELHIFNNIYTNACHSVFTDHAHADLGLGPQPVRDLVAGHWEMDDLTSPSCTYDYSPSCE